MRKLLPIIALLFFSVPTAQAQIVRAYSVIYRPPGVQYDVLRGEHFDLIYQRGGRSEAAELAFILEQSLPEATRLMGVRRTLKMPVVLNRYNDVGNGYVTPLSFRQEIENVALKGKNLSVRSPTWFDTVGPHELVHALHAEMGSGFGFTGILRLFAPDMARAFNLWVPPGIAEGVAVYYESRLRPGVGRLNHPFFTMQFRASAADGHPWRLAQMLEAPAYSRPADRYYKGGAELVEYLADSTGVDFFRRAAKFHYRMPLLGYGPSLWYGTKTAPWTLGRRFRRDAVAAEQRRLAALGPLTEASLLAGEVGDVHRRPRWLDDQTVVVYLTGYHKTRGFYRVDVPTGQYEVIAHESITEDIYFSLSADSSSILHARYIDDAFSAIRSTVDVHRIDVETGHSDRITRGMRVLSPAQASDGTLWAIQNEGSFSRWVRISGEDSVALVGPSSSRITIVSVEPSPVGGKPALIVNAGGRQGLFHGEGDDILPLVVFRDASVYDVTWTNDGRYLVFAADVDDVLNIYAYRMSDGRLVRLTNVAYGAIEPAVSPDGSTLAFIEHKDQRFDLMTLPFRPADGVFVSSAVVKNAAYRWQNDVPPAVVASKNEVPTPYRSLAYLKPRLLYPTFYVDETADNGSDARLGTGVGLAIQGADPLVRWTYWGEGFWRNDRVWGEFGLATAASVLRPSVRVYDRPETLAAIIEAPDGTTTSQRVIRQERGAQFGIGLPITLRDNVYKSTASLSLSGRIEEQRFFDRDGTAFTDFDRRVTLTPSAYLGLGIQSNLRDLVPNSGLIVAATAEIDLSAESGDERQALITEATAFLPFLKRFSTGIRLHSTMVTQNRSNIYDLDNFMPRGYEDVALAGGTFVRYGGEVIQPLWYIDGGLIIVPFYFRSLYVYGFGERLEDLSDSSAHLTSYGAGLGLEFRVFYVLDLTIRVGGAYRHEWGDWERVYR